VIVRAADGLPQDTRNAGRLSYRLNYTAQLQNMDHHESERSLWHSERSLEHRRSGEGRGVLGEQTPVCVCVCVCVWYVSDLTHNGRDPILLDESRADSGRFSC